MEPLRRAHCLARFVLAWFLFALGVAVAAPLVHPQAMELVCSAGGRVKTIVHTDDGAVEMGAAHLDCALCLIASAPPSAPFVAPQPPRVSTLAPLSLTRTWQLAVAALPWQARAPPTFP